ncbi:hypothetical protein LWI29_011580 [Acer saccharum]|uniref:Cyclic nucleotide-binding domain-containing protein n=1 Tax=Acer saccharum TaxID=4024 RepID=A0AA39SL09_ACESA|nr:hypothetical protein LWI29_011580 [Acer saccharum]
MMIFLVLILISDNSKTRAFKIAVILVTIYLFFYSTRIFQIYKLFTGKAKRIIGQIVINLILYLYGGHLFGGIWYAFAVRKTMDWSDAYTNCVISQAGKNITKLVETLGGLNDVCQNKTDSKSYEWGIFKDAFESGILEVGRFRSWNEVSLVHVCDRLKPVVYAKRANIVRKGKPIDEMSIVLQGKLCTFSSKDIGSTSNVSRESRKDLLKEGDFCGEELVNRVQDEHSSSKKLISNRTIKALTKVEALVLRTNDLKDIYNQKAKVIQAFLRKRRIMISGRNGQTPPGELTAPEIVVEGINSSVLEIVVESGVECDEDEDEEKGFLSHFNSRFFS